MTVGVAYETDLAQAYRVLSEAVAAAPGVLAEPAPQVSFEGFDESSIRMVFRFWIEWQNTNAVNLQTQLTQVIMDVARREGINIPVPDPHGDAAQPDRACPAQTQRLADGQRVVFLVGPAGVEPATNAL